jgi:hypothetical protein
MWYNFAASKEQSSKINVDNNWFEIVPENIWLLNNTKIGIYKSIELNKNNSDTLFLIKKDGKEISKCKDLETCKRKALGLAHDKNNSKKSD